MSSATIYPEQIVNDFEKIKRNKLLKYDKETNKFKWEKANGKIIGDICLSQRSAPTVDIEIYCVINDKVVYAYHSHAYHEIECDIEWFDEDAQKYYRIETSPQDPYDIVAKGINISDGVLCNSVSPSGKLEIIDEWNVQHVVSIVK
jgi:hypothetical protein